LETLRARRLNGGSFFLEGDITSYEDQVEHFGFKKIMVTVGNTRVCRWVGTEINVKNLKEFLSQNVRRSVQTVRITTAKPYNGQQAIIKTENTPIRMALLSTVEDVMESDGIAYQCLLVTKYPVYNKPISPRGTVEGVDIDRDGDVDVDVDVTVSVEESFHEEIFLCFMNYTRWLAMIDGTPFEVAFVDGTEERL